MSTKEFFDTLESRVDAGTTATLAIPVAAT